MSYVLINTAAGLSGLSLAILMDLLLGTREVNTVEDAVNYN